MPWQQNWQWQWSANRYDSFREEGKWEPLQSQAEPSGRQQRSYRPRAASAQSGTWHDGTRLDKTPPKTFVEVLVAEDREFVKMEKEYENENEKKKEKEKEIEMDVDEKPAPGKNPAVYELVKKLLVEIEPWDGDLKQAFMKLLSRCTKMAEYTPKKQKQKSLAAQAESKAAWIEREEKRIKQFEEDLSCAHRALERRKGAMAEAHAELTQLHKNLFDECQSKHTSAPPAVALAVQSAPTPPTPPALTRREWLKQQLEHAASQEYDLAQATAEEQAALAGYVREIFNLDGK